MNTQRRKEIREIAGQLESLRNDLEEILEEEKEAFENIPENLCNGSKYEELEVAIGKFEYAVDNLSDDVINNLYYEVAF